MTRLADQIIEAAGAAGAPAELRNDARLFASEIRGAAIYEIDPAACELAAVIAGVTKGVAFQATYPVSRVPFRRCWFEWIGQCENYVEGSKRDAVIYREGVLVVADETHQRGTAYHARSTNDGLVSLSPYSLCFDWSPLPDLECDTTEEGGRLRIARGYDGMTDELRSREMDRRYQAQASSFGESTGAEVIRICGSLSKVGAVLSGELEANHNTTLFLRGLLVCLNSRNLLATGAPENVDKLNRARARTGKPPRVSFSRVKVNLSAVMRRKTEAASRAGNMRAHLVAGHFKVRKSGVFWWSPFVRGDEQNGKVTRTGYQVVRTADNGGPNISAANIEGMTA